MNIKNLVSTLYDLKITITYLKKNSYSLFFVWSIFLTVDLSCLKLL